ncbi:MAG: adenine deaminase C-terminal domain-containing protein [Fusobacterium sp.]
MIANRLKNIGGGVVIAEKEKIKDEINFPIAGMLSNEDAYKTGNNIERINNLLRKMGIECDSPITRPSSLALIVIPEVKISDLGIIDVLNQKIIKQI